MIVEGSAQRAQQLLPPLNTRNTDDAFKTQSVSDDHNSDIEIRYKHMVQTFDTTSLRSGHSTIGRGGNPPDMEPKSQLGNRGPGDVPLNMPRVNELLRNMTAKRTGLTQREYLVVMALSLMFESGVIDCSCAIEAQAMLLHMVLLREIQLSDRAIDSICFTGSLSFLKDFAKMALSLLSSHHWLETMSNIQSPCDLSDLIDGRLFLELQVRIRGRDTQNEISPRILSEFEALVSLVSDLCGTKLQVDLARRISRHEDSTHLLTMQKRERVNRKSAEGPTSPPKCFHLAIQFSISTCSRSTSQSMNLQVQQSKHKCQKLSKN
jgi:hypothetical protein